MQSQPLLDLRQREDVGSAVSRADLRLIACLLVFFPDGDGGGDADSLLALLHAVAAIIPGTEGEDVDVRFALVGLLRKALTDGLKNGLRRTDAHVLLVRCAEGDGGLVHNGEVKERAGARRPSPEVSLGTMLGGEGFRPAERAVIAAGPLVVMHLVGIGLVDQVA